MTNRIPIDSPAPNFTLSDLNGQTVSLKDYQGKKHVILVFNRGFAWPFCQRHMAQLRQDYQEFSKRNAEVIVLGPEDARAFQNYWAKNNLPFVGLPDPKHQVLKLYGQEINLFKLGRMPAQVLIDRNGIARFIHYGHSMSDIPPNEEILALLDQINQE